MVRATMMFTACALFAAQSVVARELPSGTFHVTDGDMLIPDADHLSNTYPTMGLHSDLDDPEGTNDNNLVFADSADVAARSAHTSGSLVASTIVWLPWWEKGVMPYEIAPGVPPELRELFMRAIQAWSQATCLTFRPRTADDKSYVRVQPHPSACNSAVGRVFNAYSGFGVGELNLGPKCDYSAVLHEIGHAAGLRHEHSRPDRSRFTKFYEGTASNDQATDMDVAASMIGRYDFASVMHYSPSAFQTDARQIIHPSEPISDRTQLTPSDIAAIDFAYGNCNFDDVSKWRPIVVGTNLEKDKTIEVDSKMFPADSLIIVYVTAAGGPPYLFEDAVYDWSLDSGNEAGAFDFRVVKDSHARTVQLSFAGGKMAPNGLYTLTISVGSALMRDIPKATITLRINVAAQPVCHGVRGDGGCSGHGKCVGGDTPWPCKCDENWMGGACDVESVCKGKGGDVDIGSNKHRLSAVVPVAPRGDPRASQFDAVWGSLSASNGNGLRLKGVSGSPRGGRSASGHYITARFVPLTANEHPRSVVMDHIRSARWFCSPTGVVVGATVCQMHFRGGQDVMFDVGLEVESVNGASTVYAFVMNGLKMDRTVTMTTPAGAFEAVVLTFLWEIRVDANGKWGSYITVSGFQAQQVAGASASFQNPMPEPFGPLARAQWRGDFFAVDSLMVGHTGPEESSSFFSGVEVSCDSLKAYDVLPARLAK